MDKQFFVEVVNLTAGKMYSLPTLYTDRVEACVCGQNYVRDRQQENHDDVFYRVLLAKNGKIAEPSYFTIVEEDEEKCNGDCFDCQHCDSCSGENVDDPDDDDDEIPTLDLADLLSAFNVVRPNY